MIRDKAVTGNHVTKRELINSIEANFRTSLTYEWIHCFLPRQTDEVRKAIVIPGGLPRIQVSQWHRDHYIDLIIKWVPLIPAELILHLDKAGLSDWKDSTSKPVFVATDLGNSMIQ
jgi:hypothetical protein